MTTTMGGDWTTAEAERGLSRRPEDAQGASDGRPDPAPVDTAAATRQDLRRVEVGLYRLIAGWTVVYAAGSWLLEYAYSRLGVRHPDPLALAVKCVVYAVVWAPLLATAVALSFRRPVRGQEDVSRLVLHVLALLIAPFCWGTLSYTLCLWLAPGWRPLGLARMYRTTGSSVLFVYSITVLICHVLLDVRRRYAGQAAVLDVAERAARVRLQVLAMELQPHFVGNALHSVSALLGEHPARAAEALRRLRDLLAQALQADRRAQVSVREELTMLRWYTDTQHLRFGDRLRIEWDVDPAVLDDAVPTMFLQPLVENAIKFSAEAVDRPATVTISLAADGANRLAVRVRDDGVGLGRGGRRGAGVGLANVRERLERLYGGDHALRLTSGVPGPGAVVEISLPRRPVSQFGAPRDSGPEVISGAGARARSAPSRGATSAPAPGPDVQGATWAHSVLRRGDVWAYLVAWVLAFGSATWLLDLAVATATGTLAATRWQGSGHAVVALLFLPVLAVALGTAERWPVRTWRDWRRVVGQVAIAVVIGPLWGTIAYGLNPALSLWNPNVGRWGLIAIEAKGVLFVYGTATVFAHVALRARRQRAVELDARAARADLAVARVQAATLEFHTQRVTAALDAVLARLERLPPDTAGANDVLVGVSTAIEGALALSRSDTVALHDVLRLADAHAALIGGQCGCDVFRWEAPAAVLATRVAPMAIWPDLARLLHDAAVTGTSVRATCTGDGAADGTVNADTGRMVDTMREAAVHVEDTPVGVGDVARAAGGVHIRITLGHAPARPRAA